MNSTNQFGELMDCGRAHFIKKVDVLDSWVLEIKGTKGTIVFGADEAEFLERAFRSFKRGDRDFRRIKGASA